MKGFKLKVKNFFIFIDQIVFRKFYQKFIVKFINKTLKSKFEKSFNSYIVIEYMKNKNCELATLCDKYGSDKGEISESGHPYPWPSHNYTDFYSRLFLNRRDEIKTVVEIGIGTNNQNITSNMGVLGKPGASLRVWRDYFSNAMIYGGDIDKEILIEEPRIKTFFINQLDADSVKYFWNLVDKRDVDFILDDGLHTFDAGIIFFKNSFDRLSCKGYYIIEDVSPKDYIKYKNFFNKSKYNVDFIHLSTPNVEVRDNSLIMIRKSS
jgi:hypothetical protein